MILNLGCGSTRPQGHPWINIDNLHAEFPNPECPERKNMDSESNYLNHDLLQPLPFADGTVDGILASHLLEHFVLQDCLDLLEDWYRALRPEGVLRISLPCPKLFHEGTVAGKKDWGEKVYEMRGKLTTMMNYALFFYQHKQILGEDAVYCMLYDVGFRKYEKKAFSHTWMPSLADLDNRPDFSFFVEGMK